MSQPQSEDERAAEKRKVDILRDTPVRLLGYANEVGEAFRAQVHVNVVRASYGVATAYMLADVVSKSNDAWIEEKRRSAAAAAASAAGGHEAISSKGKRRIAEIALDTMLWQGFASVAIPGFTINRLCWASGLVLLRVAPGLPPRMRKWCVTAAGLSAIPFIVKPIDHFVDWALDTAVRPHFTEAKPLRKSEGIVSD